MSKRWKFIRASLANVGYSTIESVDGVTPTAIDADGTLYYTDASGNRMKVKYPSKTPINVGSTEIKSSDLKVVDTVDNSGGVIHALVFDTLSIADVMAVIESKDGSTQTYQILAEGIEIIPEQDWSGIPASESVITLKVISEDGSAFKIYTFTGTSFTVTNYDYQDIIARSAEVGVETTPTSILTEGTAYLPLTFSIVEGDLYPGLSLDENTGIISGTPTSTPTWNTGARIMVTDANQNQAVVRVIYVDAQKTFLPLSNTPYTDLNQSGALLNQGIFVDGEGVYFETPPTGFQQSFAPTFVGDIDMASWDMSSYENLEDMFRGATLFNGDISGWDVSSVKFISNMFREATSFNQDIGNWDVGSVRNADGMFEYALAFNQDISGWVFTTIDNMTAMFHQAIAFNQDISGWDVSTATNMEAMFAETQAFNQDLSGWNVTNVGSNYGGFDADAIGWILPNSRPVWVA